MKNNVFLMAPLAKEAGGTKACGKPIFESRADPDYLAILDTFDEVAKLIEEQPRKDMVDVRGL